MIWAALAYFYATGALLALLYADLVGDGNYSRVRSAAFVAGWPILVPVFYLAAFIDEVRK